MVTFDPNGGTVSPSSKKVTYTKEYGELPVPARNGRYKFTGWYTERNGGVLINKNSKKLTNADETLFAHWERISLGEIGAPKRDTVLMIGANPRGNSAKEAFANINVYSVIVESDNGCIINLNAKNNTGKGNTDKKTTVWKNLAGNTNNGSIVGATWKSNYLSLNGTSSYVNLGKVNFKNKVIYNTEISVKEIQNGEAEIISNFESGGAGLYLENGYPKFGVWSATANGYLYIKSPNQVPKNKKVRIEGYYDGYDMYIKVNGTIVAQQ